MTPTILSALAAGFGFAAWWRSCRLDALVEALDDDQTATRRRVVKALGNDLCALTKHTVAISDRLMAIQTRVQKIESGRDLVETLTRSGGVN